MREEIEIVRISDAQLKILRSVLGERIYYFYADKLQVEGVPGNHLFWASGFALALSTINNTSDKFRTYINISADYRSTAKDTGTYYEFDVNVSNAPLWQEGALQTGKLSSLRVFSDPILMIEIYQDNSEDGNTTVAHDCAILFYSQTSKILMRARQGLIGGVDVVLEDAYIETLVKNRKLRTTLV
ncbi:hypothetical protein [Botryobacter ruber]|uniref:hypothetical protein n=1 Tax=Botryobacter ruber TaxID=2171629 RepID=UPI000F64D945|nr:hypothetical protein [Botryobacter ruber]